jgi:Bacterial Ig-like domain
VRQLTRLLAGICAIGVLSGCANRGGLGPPGGPIDTSAPRVEQVTPESGSVSQRAGAVQFLFNKVISDAPGRGELNQYFLISPTDGEPRVNWHRDHIDVRPRHGFRPNTAYAVTLLPGLADVRGNAMKEPVTTVFSTGTSFPRFGILGSIFDWAAERPANGALIEAISRPDSVVFLAASDSLGQFVLGPFGPGRYTLIGFVDKNTNRALDQGELWDSTSILITNSRPVAELLAIQRDTVGPRMSGLTREDSVTLRISFDRGLDPAQPLTPALFRVQRSDSTELPIASVIGARAATDSAARRDSVRRDSVARGLSTPRDTTARRDTTAAAKPAAPATVPSSVPPSAVPIPRPQQPNRPSTSGRPSTVGPPLPRPSRPAPETAVLLKLAPPATFDTGATYRITARGVRNVIGRPATMTRTVTIPKPPPPTARDSSRRGASARDSLRARDSVRTPPRRPPSVR